MATIVTIQKAQSEGRYIVVSEEAGVKVAEVVIGDPTAVAAQIQTIIGGVPSFLLLESGDFLLQEVGDKIII